MHSKLSSKWCHVRKIKNKISYRKKIKQNLKQFISGNSNNSTQNSRDLLSFNITKEFSHGSNSFFSSTHFYESYLFDCDYDTADEDEDEYDDENTICEDSFCSDNFYSDDEDDDYLVTSNKSNATVNSKKSSAFTPSKTSSRKSLLMPETSIVYKDQTLLVDYICNICNLQLFKGQCIDCEFDENRNKLFLKQDEIFSSTMIANETIKNVKNHKHEIEVNYLLFRRPIDSKNLNYTRVTHF